MLRSFVWGVVSAIAMSLLLGFFAVKSGLIPANADAVPGPIETWMARTSLDATLGREAPKEANPVALTDQNLRNGVQLFAQNCAACHGSEMGSASASPIAKGLYPRPPQLATDGVEEDAEGESFWKIKHGIRLTGMPSFSASLSDKDIWTLALFLKHMDKLPAPVQADWKQVQNWPVPAK